MVKVSVCLAVYKTKPEYLKECIESILNQTFTDFEFLIVDDCPEDKECEKIIKSYADNRIKYYRNEKNLGISRTRNKLLDLATGEYIAVMDHDDISLPTRLEKEVAYLDEHPEIGVVSSRVDCFPTGNKLYFPAEDIEIKKLLTDICALVHPASMIRKSVLDNNNIFYEEDFTPSEDYCLWLRLIEFTQFHNIQEVLLKYREHENNTSKSQQNRMIKATEKLHNWVRNRYFSLYQSYMQDRTKVFKISVFKIPFFKIISKINRIEIYLFSIIPVIIIKRKILAWPK